MCTHVNRCLPVQASVVTNVKDYCFLSVNHLWLFCKPHTVFLFFFLFFFSFFFFSSSCVIHNLLFMYRLWMHGCVHVCMCVWVCVCVCIWTCIHACVWVNLLTFMYCVDQSMKKWIRDLCYNVCHMIAFESHIYQQWCSSVGFYWGGKRGEEGEGGLGGGGRCVVMCLCFP